MVYRSFLLLLVIITGMILFSSHRLLFPDQADLYTRLHSFAQIDPFTAKTPSNMLMYRHVLPTNVPS